MRRDDICLCLGPAARVQLHPLRADRNTPRKLVWRAEIMLATADGCDTNALDVMSGMVIGACMPRH